MTAMAAENGTKSEFALLQTSSLLLHLVQYVKCRRIFLELDSKGLSLSSQKKEKLNKSREIRKFHVAVLQRKSVMLVKSCFFVD